MTVHLPEPRHADKGLHMGFVTASIMAHGAIVLLVALGGGGGSGGGGRPSSNATAAQIVSETEVVRAEDDDPELAEIAGKGAAEAPPASTVPEEAPPATPAKPEEPTTAVEPLPSATTSPPPATSAAPRRPRPTKTPGTASAQATGSAAVPSPSASAGPGSGKGPGDESDDGPARKAPNIAAVFTKELPRFASAIDAWSALEPGPAGSVRVTLSLGADGKVIPTDDPVPSKPPPPPALAEAVRRVTKGLRATLALPGHPVRAGRIELQVSARVSRGPARPDIQKFRLESRFADKNGESEFELESGLKVTFDVTVERVTVD